MGNGKDRSIENRTGDLGLSARLDPSPAPRKGFSIKMILNNDRERFDDEDLSDHSQQQHIKMASNQPPHCIHKHGPTMPSIPPSLPQRIRPNTSQGRGPQARQHSQSQNAAHVKMSRLDGQDDALDHCSNLEETSAVPQELTQRYTSCVAQMKGAAECPVAQSTNSRNPPPLASDEKSSSYLRRRTNDDHTTTSNAMASRRFRAKRVEYIRDLENTVHDQRVLIGQLREENARCHRTLFHLQQRWRYYRIMMRCCEITTMCEARHVYRVRPTLSETRGHRHRP